MTTAKSIIWLRSDLRLSDNPALTAALQAGSATALYIHETDATLRPIGAAARWWLHHSLNALGQDLAAIGVPLLVESGKASAVLDGAITGQAASAVFWNRRYAPAEREIDTGIKAALSARGVEAHSFAANLLAEPWEIETLQHKPYSVFTPFAKALRQRDIRAPLRKPVGNEPGGHTDVDTHYRAPHWAKKLSPHWKIGEAAARGALEDFLDQKLAVYAEGRDFPARESTSRLSPHLRFGEISPRQIWHAATAMAQHDHHLQGAVDKFLSELAWRDFNYHQLYHRENIAKVSMQPKYEGLEWRRSGADLKRWRAGQTGIPIVDAGMRELWANGFMQNRVRMITASLLAKNLLLDWRLGEAWFWDCLLDADVANNPCNWQWVAGSGLDASPYYRIFNPVTQGERFDADGAYVRHWVPELANLPDEWVQQPFAAPASMLDAAGVVLGKTYPEPVVDLKSSRERALAAAKALE
ncbi:deoxyribodipyrimidine photo-lyase [Devosia sp.]|uniref:cryptochrome/photolyase family protein n=1 Tax=Devosia sp. TaxID=1871048 RepID=UPI003264FAD2